MRNKIIIRKKVRLQEIQIRPVTNLTQMEIEPLVIASQDEGFDFIYKLAEEYINGINRFDKTDEMLLAAYDGATLVGICGLNCDQYLNQPEIGRFRRFYVLPEYRGRGVGRKLLQTIIAEAKKHYKILTLRTSDNLSAIALYEAVGFSQEPRFKNVTHFMVFDSQENA